MLKSLAAIVVAATIAAAITLLSAPTTDVVAGPLPKPAADAMKACKSNRGPIPTVSGPSSATRTCG